MCGWLTLIVGVFHLILVLNNPWQFKSYGSSSLFFLKELKDSLLVIMNETFSLGGDFILRYHDRLCVPDVGYLWIEIVTEAYGSKYSIHPGSTKIYHDLKQIFWWDCMKKDIDEYVASDLIVNRIRQHILSLAF